MCILFCATLRLEGVVALLRPDILHLGWAWATLGGYDGGVGVVGTLGSGLLLSTLSSECS